MEPITFIEVSILDVNSEYRGVRTHHLMEEAGKGVAEHILDTGGSGQRILVLCGSGNNGGDGLVAARYLINNAEVEVVLMRSRERVRTELSRTNLRHAEEVGVPISVAGDDLAQKVAEADIIVDSMLGVGVTGSPRDVYAEAVSAINASGKRIVSVDIPTGWGSDLAVAPESTVTFHAPKVGMGPECGDIVVKPIGIPEEAERYAGPGELLLVPRVPTDAHKGGRGTVPSASSRGSISDSKRIRRPPDSVQAITWPSGAKDSGGAWDSRSGCWRASRVPTGVLRPLTRASQVSVSRRESRSSSTWPPVGILRAQSRAGITRLSLATSRSPGRI